MKLYIDGELLRQENVAPYEWGHAGKPDELLGLSVGDHIAKAVVTDTNGTQTETSIIVKVNAASSGECSSTTSISWDTRTEVVLNGNSSCVQFDNDLSGEVVQFWDSDENSSCNFNGTISSVDGNGSISMTSTYKQSSDFTGKILKFTPSNGCQYIKVRAY